jgi:hypothetical protein
MGFPVRRRKLFGREQLVYGVFDGEEMGRFFDDGVNGRTIVGRIACAHHDGRGRGPQLDDVRHFPAGHAFHGIVGQNKVVDDGIETGKRLACGTRRIHLIADVVEKHLGQKTRVNIIINHQHGSQLRLNFFIHNLLNGSPIARPKGSGWSQADCIFKNSRLRRNLPIAAALKNLHLLGSSSNSLFFENHPVTQTQSTPVENSMPQLRFLLCEFETSDVILRTYSRMPVRRKY